jgi:hypothetical protein
MRRTRAATCLAIFTTLALAGAVPAAIAGHAIAGHTVPRAAVTVHTAALKCSIAQDDVGTGSVLG